MSGRPVLTLRPKESPPAKPAEVPVDSVISFCNWKVGNRRPSKRYPTAEAAFAEARRLRGLYPGATIHTFRLTRIEEVTP